MFNSVWNKLLCDNNKLQSLFLFYNNKRMMPIFLDNIDVSSIVEFYDANVFLCVCVCFLFHLWFVLPFGFIYFILFIFFFFVFRSRSLSIHVHAKNMNKNRRLHEIIIFLWAWNFLLARKMQRLSDKEEKRKRNEMNKNNIQPNGSWRNICSICVYFFQELFFMQRIRKRNRLSQLHNCTESIT